MVHAAPLTKRAPNANSVNILMSGRCTPGVAANVIDLHGPPTKQNIHTYLTLISVSDSLINYNMYLN